MNNQKAYVINISLTLNIKLKTPFQKFKAFEKVIKEIFTTSKRLRLYCKTNRLEMRYFLEDLSNLENKP